MEKIAVVLTNLGGPDSLQAVRPFLFNLFNDRAIIGMPQPFRWMLAQLLSRRREKTAQEIYRHMGGSTPLLEWTNKQAAALQTSLNSDDKNGDKGDDYKVFPLMRYWHPRADEVVAEINNYQPDRICLIPLYPQFSTTTTASSQADFLHTLEGTSLSGNVPVDSLCCYPTDDHFIAAHARLILPSLQKLQAAEEASPEKIGPKPQVIFSAHGLPEKIIVRGDPYQWQVEQTVNAVVNELGKQGAGEVDWRLCYQSRVGPMKWIGPTLDQTLKDAGALGRAVIVVPIAFVSEHSETLVELDIEYREIAGHEGIVSYERIPALGLAEDYIDCLTSMVRRVRDRGLDCPGMDGFACPGKFGHCPNNGTDVRAGGE